MTEKDTFYLRQECFDRICNLYGVWRSTIMGESNNQFNSEELRKLCIEADKLYEWMLDRLSADSIR